MDTKKNKKKFSPAGILLLILGGILIIAIVSKIFELVFDFLIYFIF